MNHDARRWVNKMGAADVPGAQPCTGTGLRVLHNTKREG